MQKMQEQFFVSFIKGSTCRGRAKAVQIVGCSICFRVLSRHLLYPRMDGMQKMQDAIFCFSTWDE
ncbi:hypothetical protein [Methylophaga sp. OBS4]|uniref:hypothetical protein n=1 Tax=Methylophaga sp. OBS4 TaxID=2991935 RepID=UPI0022550DA9|nr:hypothetical protein [Methylophaga sp. OBS4]MCX4187175.1 hypothetical protein [Methylophaga sp. OBS4]